MAPLGTYASVMPVLTIKSESSASGIADSETIDPEKPCYRRPSLETLQLDPLAFETPHSETTDLKTIDSERLAYGTPVSGTPKLDPLAAETPQSETVDLETIDSETSASITPTSGMAASGTFFSEMITKNSLSKRSISDTPSEKYDGSPRCHQHRDFFPEESRAGTISESTSHINCENKLNNLEPSGKLLWIENYKCCNCGKLYVSELRLVKHMKDSCVQKCCSYCSYKTYRTWNLKAHMKRKHLL
ncbi:PREDICTED: uncharacterized protein LOC106744529 [Dinoponera quadriceps]|uniref:Uncharacterized protein LOC106744529 n=1 Tax=Dinoponera quadriceps TaxID=609295 RepID=A0A6P3X981_DINQU|nr:PREDICTED: uncharacterized protein LOC106744529 [Dinoponera quadriceps]